jgi:(E)-4-hydroxy-3-methylbut-2-enyl-diphosphate synthase
MSHNPIRPWRNIDRRKSRKIHVGPVPVGGDAPISVQTMTNTLTTDVKATVEQIQRCAEAGADPDLPEVAELILSGDAAQ